MFFGSRDEEEEVHRSDVPQEYEYNDGDTVLSVSKAIRLGFLRKVYGILSVQLAVTALVCAIAMKAVATAKVEIPIFLWLRVQGAGCRVQGAGCRV